MDARSYEYGHTDSYYQDGGKCERCGRVHRNFPAVRPLMRKPRYLVLCTGGTVRSTTVAHILKYDYGYDALAASLEKNTLPTLDMLCEWADNIIVVEDKHLEQLQRELPKHSKKTRLFPIGKDIWRMSLHPDLYKRIEELDLDTFLVS